MSSKSRKQSSKGGRKSGPSQSSPSTPAVAGHDAEGDHQEPTAEDFLAAEELLKTPKGKSPLMFGFLILLLIFLLIVFVAGDAFYAGQRSMGRDSTVMRWTHPSRGVQEVAAIDFQILARKLEYGGGMRVDEEDVAQFLILDQLAKDAGVRVSDDELRERLRQVVDQLGGVDAYKARFARFPGNVSGFESFVKDQLSVQRLLTLSQSIATAVPDVDQLLDSWAQQRQLFTFDLTYVIVDDFRERALAEPPADDELEAWFEGQNDVFKREYLRPASRKVELIGALLDDPERDFATLLASYPPEEEGDPEALGRDYYERSFFTRFRRVTPIPADAEGAPEDPTERLYLPFEEVREQAIHEAEVKAALERFRAELAVRAESGDQIDLAAEAERLGLDLLAPEKALTQPELRDLGGLAGIYIAGPLFGLAESGQLTAGVTIGSDGLSFGRAVEINAAATPSVVEIREELLERWADERAGELASEVLDGVRTRLAGDGGPDAADLAVDFDAFAAAAEAAGLPLERIADFDRRAPAAAEPTPVQTFLRTAFMPFTLEEGEVDEVRKDFDGERAYLLRLDGKRNPDPSSMTAGDFQRLLAQPALPPESDPYAVERLRERYGLWLATDEVATEESADA
jgi:hypothetical protein